MNPVILIAAMSCPASDVSLSDLERFTVPVMVAKVQWELSRDHAYLMRNTVQTWNRWDVVEQWEIETARRCRCWDLLDWILRVDKTAGAKLNHLAELKQLLGDANYRQGWMPSPIPTYRGP